MYSIVAVPHTGERKDVEDSVPEDLTEPFDPETGIDPRKQPSGRETDKRLGPTGDTSASSFCCSAMALRRVRQATMASEHR